jgi:putative ABC transport system substrate-binding protein
MNRREVITLLGGAPIAWLPATAHGQPRRPPTVGILWHAASEAEEAPFLTPFRETLQKLGYVEGRTILLEQRFPAEQYQLFDSMAADLVARKVDVLVAVSPLAAAAAKRATTSIPIVFVIHPNPVEAGLVASLARPGGNMTGLSNIANDLSAKQLELLKEALPGMSRVGVLTNPAFGVVARRFLEEFGTAAARLRLDVRSKHVQSPDEFAPVFAELASEGADAIALGPDSMYMKERARIAELALAHRLPVMAINEVMVRDGGFLYYGPHFQSLFENAASYVDRILKGAKPADLPVQQPTKIYLIVNQKTASAINLSLAPSFLARADEVIE